MIYEIEGKKRRTIEDEAHNYIGYTDMHTHKKRRGDEKHTKIDEQNATQGILGTTLTVFRVQIRTCAEFAALDIYNAIYRNLGRKKKTEERKEAKYTHFFL